MLRLFSQCYRVVLRKRVCVENSKESKHYHLVIQENTYRRCHSSIFVLFLLFLRDDFLRFAHLDKFSLSFSSSSFVICVHLLHPKPPLFKIHYYFYLNNSLFSGFRRSVSNYRDWASLTIEHRILNYTPLQFLLLLLSAKKSQFCVSFKQRSIDNNRRESNRP